MMLSELKNKEHAKITGFAGQGRFQQKMQSIGIREGKCIEVIAKHPLGGPIVIRVDNITFTLGRGMTRKITVEKI